MPKRGSDEMDETEDGNIPCDQLVAGIRYQITRIIQVPDFPTPPAIGTFLRLTHNPYSAQFNYVVTGGVGGIGPAGYRCDLYTFRRVQESESSKKVARELRGRDADRAVQNPEGMFGSLTIGGKRRKKRTKRGKNLTRRKTRKGRI